MQKVPTLSILDWIQFRRRSHRCTVLCMWQCTRNKWLNNLWFLHGTATYKVLFVCGKKCRCCPYMFSSTSQICEHFRAILNILPHTSQRTWQLGVCYQAEIPPQNSWTRLQNADNSVCNEPKYRSLDGEATECRLCKHCSCILNTVTSDYIWLRKSSSSEQGINFVWPNCRAQRSGVRLGNRDVEPW